MDSLIYREESYKIIGACMEVHRQLGPGFLESVYQEALAMEFVLQGIPFEEQIDVRLFYKEMLMNKKFKPDFLCYDTILLEIKAAVFLTPIDHAQVINALNATKLTLGLLVNFGEDKLVYQRFANTMKKGNRELR